nr:ATP-binding cassette sub-family B member 9-like [Ciona intestinalis]XP_018669999.1 ATP-binding cassette sub-family B member 9-like [Ciona intestinalis]|eukprot:XP_009860482.1 ATP-binding cassette sub-family B member 9-like [Ciona intestinalis]
MVQSRTVLLLYPFLSLLDFFATAIILAHGNNWNLLLKSAQHYSFASSFVDFWIFPVIKTSFIIGASIGILKNPEHGPKNCKKTEWLVVTVACVNLYFACIKMLVFSHDTSFVVGPNLSWFWVLFAWSNLGALIFLIQWHFLSNLKLSPSRQINVEAPENEKQSLLGNSHEGYGSLANNGSIINASTSNSSSNSSSTTSSPSKPQKDSDDKTFIELASRATIGKMMSYSLPDWPLLLLGSIFLVGAAVGQIFLPLYVGRVISAIVQPDRQTQFTSIIFEMALIGIGVSICAGLRAGCLMYYMQRLNIRIRNSLFKSILHQEIGFFDEVRTGDITSRLTSDTTTMSDTIGLNFNIFIRSMIKGVGVCIFMFALSWRLSVITFMGLPMIFAVSKVYGSYYKKTQKQVQDRFAKANEVAQEVCSSMQTVRSFANENGEIAQYKIRLLDVLKVQFKQAASYSVYVWCSQVFEQFLMVFTLWYGGQLLISGTLTSAHFIAFILYQEELGECFSEIGDVYTGMMQALGAAEKVFELIGRKPRLSLEDGTEQPTYIEGRISFKNVSFAYPSRPEQPVLENISFEVNPGEVVALVGPSGGGKSSCVKLMQRFYEPTSGSVLLDGMSVSSFKHQFLHEQISLVGQEPVLYARSIKENIIYGLSSDHYTEQSVLDASKLANAHSFVIALPDSYQTETGEKGTQLSGGQKQRVAIARALVRNPKVLLLDEATSALDTESEYLVQEALERSKSHRTVLLIAHRLSTVERADRIVVIVKGKVEEVGSHNELMAKKGTYYNLVYRQLHNVSQKTGDESSDKAVDNEGVTETLQPSRRTNSWIRHRSISRDSSSTTSSSSVGSPVFGV